MAKTSTERFGIFLLLALVMAATRLHHFSVIPDASWGIFFLAGFWLRGSARWAFPLLIAEAVLAKVDGNGEGLELPIEVAQHIYVGTSKFSG